MKSEIVVVGGGRTYFACTARLNAAINDVLEFLEKGTPVRPGSLVAIEFKKAVDEARDK